MLLIKRSKAGVSDCCSIMIVCLADSKQSVRFLFNVSEVEFMPNLAPPNSSLYKDEHRTKMILKWIISTGRE